MAIYGLQNNSTLEIITTFEWNGLPEEVSSPLLGYSIYSGSLDSFTGSYYEDPIPQYFGGFSGSFSGSFYGITDTSGSMTGSLTGSLTGSVTGAESITFKTTSTVPITVGSLVWNDGDGTLDLGLKGGNVTLQVGQQQFAMAFNDDGTALSKGDVVYIDGAQGNRISVKRASAVSDPLSAHTLGLAAEDIADGEEGLIISSGVLHGLNTIGLTAGETIYLSTTPGEYTQTKPTAPTHTVILGFVERVHANQGSIFVKVDNGYELEELHNVNAVNPSFGDILLYNGSVWTGSKELSGSYSLTGSLFVTGSLTGSLDGTASYAAIQKDLKAGTVSAGSWGITGMDYTYNVTFASSYSNQNYAVTITATSDARIWTIQNKLNSGFTINSNSNTPLTGDVFWISLPYNS